VYNSGEAGQKIVVFMTADRRRELFPRLCEVGNALEAIRNTTYHQGALWMLLDGILTALDVVIDTLVEAPAGGGCARHAARAGEEEA